MKAHYWAILLKPFILVCGVVFLILIRNAITRYMPEGKLKRLFLKRV